MSVITFEGVVENGQIRLPPEVSLPEKAKVYVVVPNAAVATRAYLGSPRLAHREQVADFEKVLIPSAEARRGKR